ncbi:MAG: T9SS type A sorting domain-containing protein [Bacteroidetes bacterium]|nr:T9SS type A sorting domain-containing protein [Bacteroidota bacterium]
MKLFYTFILLSNFLVAQTWVQLTDFPATERDDGVAVSLNGKAYFGTGLLAGFTLGKDFYALDLATNTWSAIASMPVNSDRQYACAFSYLNSFYVFSGAGYSNAVFTDLQRYDVATNTWTVLTGKPGNGLIGASCLEYGDKIIIVSGKFQSGTVSDEVWEYTISTNTWLQKNNFPFGGRWRAGASVLNGVGYLLFGLDNNQSFRKEMYSYNNVTDVWTKVMDFPQPKGRAYAALKTTTGKLVMFGGRDTLNTYYNDMWFYNDITGSWNPGPVMPSAGRKGGMSCASGDKFYYSCGINVSDTRLKETWMIDVPVGVKENNNAIAVSFYPNPCSTILNFEFAETNLNYEVELFDVNAKKILSQTLNGSQSIIISQLESGIYFLKIKDEKNNFTTKKIIKE